MTTEEKLAKLKDLIDPILIGATPQKKKYAKELFSDIISDLNICEVNLMNLKAKIAGFGDKNEWLGEYEKALDILILMGASDVPYSIITKTTVRWICEHNDEQKQPFTFVQLFQTHRMLTFYFGLEDKYPESLTELKKYFND
jgi:hypothetical protein